MNIFTDWPPRSVKGKLVRDLIPTIISNSGRDCTCYTLSDTDYQQALKEKLIEEAIEFCESGDLEELADVLEIIYCSLKTMGISFEELEKMRQNKAASNGSFDDKLFLID